MAKFLTRVLTYLLAFGKKIMHRERWACVASMSYQSTREEITSTPLYLMVMPALLVEVLEIRGLAARQTWCEHPRKPFLPVLPNQISFEGSTEKKRIQAGGGKRQYFWTTRSWTAGAVGLTFSARPPKTQSDPTKRNQESNPTANDIRGIHTSIYITKFKLWENLVPLHSWKDSVCIYFLLRLTDHLRLIFIATLTS
jgi:hypothetical protein